MTLTDDNFASIVVAAAEGRGVFRNIKKYLTLLPSSNLGEILLLTTATLLGWPLPLGAVQILYMNLPPCGLSPTNSSTSRSVSSRSCWRGSSTSHFFKTRWALTACHLRTGSSLRLPRCTSFRFWNWPSGWAGGTRPCPLRFDRDESALPATSTARTSR